MIKCAKVKRLLSRYLDKEADKADTELVESHLDNCLLCKQELSALSQVKGIIIRKQRKSLPQDYLVCRLREEIAGEKHTQGSFSWLTGMGNLAHRLIPVPVAAIALSIAFLLITSNQPVSKYSLEEHLLSGTQTTTETALALILGEQS
ncbi:MAG: zf-HC2 domain-containing protein [Candidatus Omnitrophica bacterium]|nr:zf-HC2 domain-containing protein [Candidatus Omnitrophota bacterium]